MCSRPLTLASACLALMLTGCAHSGTTGAPRVADLPPVPADVRACFERLTAAPPPGALTRQQIARLVADLRGSELRLSGCGKRLVGWYDALREGWR